MVITGCNNSKRFNDRYFYNQKFVNKQLFDSQYIRKLMSVYRLVRPSLLFSDAVRNNKQTCRESTTKKQVVNNHSRVLKQNGQANPNRGRIAKQCGNLVQNYTVANVNTKACNKQCVPHMCGSASSSIDKRIHMNNMQGNQFVHMNKFQPLSDSGFDVVNDFHSVEVNTIVTDTEGKQTCSTTVASRNDVKPIEKGKNKHVLVVNSNNTLARGHGTSHKRAQNTVSSCVVTPNTVTSKASTQPKKGSQTYIMAQVPFITQIWTNMSWKSKIPTKARKFRKPN